MTVTELTIPETNDFYARTASWQNDVTVQLTPGAIDLMSEHPMRVLSSGIHGGGLRDVHHIVNLMVDHRYASDDPQVDIQRRLTDMRIVDEDAVGLLTAVWMEDAAFFTAHGEDYDLFLCATAGFSNRAHVEDAIPSGLLPIGTINLMAIVRGRMSVSAQVTSVITMTEAKCAALAHLNIRSRSGHAHATGTTSDALAVGVLTAGPRDKCTPVIEYAGLATPFGRDLATAAFRAVCLSGSRYFTRLAMLREKPLESVGTEGQRI